MSASLTIVTLPGVRRNSYGYGCPMIAGIPVGRQLAASVSSKLRASSSRFFAAYAGVSSGAGGGPATGPRPPRPTVGASQTPVRSGSFPSAAQSAATGGFGFGSCAAAELVTAVTISRTMRVPCFMSSVGFDCASPGFVGLGEPVSRVRHCEGAVGRYGRGDRVPLIGGSLLQVGDHVGRGVVRG